MDHDAIAQLADAFDGHDDGTFPPSVCQDTVELLGVDDCSFAVIGQPDRRLTLCASSERARTLDRWQFSLDQGPCMDAARTGTVAVASLVEGAAPWPQLAVKARRVGYQAIAGIPLGIGSMRFGALDLQTQQPRLSPETLEQATALAGRLAGRIASHVAATLTDSAHAVDRAEVHQATGMVAAHLGVSVGDALAAMRARAWTEDRLLEDIAVAVLDGRLRLDGIDDV